MTLIEILTIIGVVISILGVLAVYTKLVFSLGLLTASVNESTAVILEVKTIVLKQDDRMDKLELDIKDKVNKEDFGLLKNDLIILTTQHRMNHKEK